MCAVVELHSVSYNFQFCPLAGTGLTYYTTSKRSHKPSMKVVENLETEMKNNYGAVLYILNGTSRIKDYAFQINRLLQTEVKRCQEAEECKIYGFTAPNGVISHKDK